MRSTEAEPTAVQLEEQGSANPWDRSRIITGAGMRAAFCEGGPTPECVMHPHAIFACCSSCAHRSSTARLLGGSSSTRQHTPDAASDALVRRNARIDLYVPTAHEMSLLLRLLASPFIPDSEFINTILHTCMCCGVDPGPVRGALSNTRHTGPRMSF